MKLKKIPYYLLIAILTVGASLTVGFLSFTGAMAMWPVLPVAIVFFGLSVAYEGEIYKQNIQGALDKLYFKRDYAKRRVAHEFFQKYFLEKVDTNDLPAIFQNFSKLLQLEATALEALEHAKTKEKRREARKKLRAIQKSLQLEEKSFCDVLFSGKKNKSKLTPDEQALRVWLGKDARQKASYQWETRLWKYRLSMAFSGICGLLMGLATVYLLSGALVSLPLLAAFPFPLIAVAVIGGAIMAGAAYACLTYNSTVDMINNDTLNYWYQRIKQDVFKKPGFRSMALMGMAVVLITLSVLLTVFTAGTWWTIMKESPRLFKWMGLVPDTISKIIMPVFMSLSNLIFGVENTTESLIALDNESKDVLKNLRNFFPKLWESLQKSWKKESFFQFVNPFRILIHAMLIPIVSIAFIGHLVSIALGADRVPRVSKFVSFLVSLFQELATDWHYFFGTLHAHASAKTPKERVEMYFSEEHGHDHGNDLPSQLIKCCFIPLFIPAALWDVVFSREAFSLEACRQSWVKFYVSKRRHTHTHVQHDEAADCAEAQDKNAEKSELPDLNATKMQLILSRLRREQQKPSASQAERKRLLKDFQKQVKPLDDAEKQLQAAEKFIKNTDPRTNSDSKFFAKLKDIIAIDKPCEPAQSMR